MIGVYVEVCFAHFREENAYAILLTKKYPPPFTIFGFAMSVCGSYNNEEYKGCRVGVTAIHEGTLNSHLFHAHNLEKLNKKNKEPVVCPKRREFLYDYRCILWFEGDKIESDLRKYIMYGNPNRRGTLCLGDSGGALEDIRLIETHSDLLALSNRCQEGKMGRLVQDPNGRECVCVWFDGQQRERYNDWSRWTHALGRYEKISELTFPKVDELFEIGPVEQPSGVFDFVQDI